MKGKAIAKKLYWDPLRLDELDTRVAFQIFDANYNGGHPVIWMQGAAGAKVDGLIGPATIAAVQATDLFSEFKSIVATISLDHKQLAINA